MRTPGIYVIRCIPTGQQYVGQAATSCYERVAKHYSLLRKGEHPNTALQLAYNMHGHKALIAMQVESTHRGILSIFEFKTLLDSREQHWIKELKTNSGDGFNRTIGGQGSLGRKLSNETKQQMSASRNAFNATELGKVTNKLLSYDRKDDWQNPAFRDKAIAGMHSVEAKQKRAASLGTRKVRDNNKTGVPGVNFDKQTNKWFALIYLNGKTTPLGRFATFELAVAARKAAEGQLQIGNTDRTTIINVARMAGGIALMTKDT